jgi:YVTN family beta-propeller protein
MRESNPGVTRAQFLAEPFRDETGVIGFARNAAPASQDPSLLCSATFLLSPFAIVCLLHYLCLSCNNSEVFMSRSRNIRVYFLLAALGIAGLVVLLREHRPSFLRPDLHLSAYVSTADGNVTVVDLVKLKAVARIAVGPGLSGMREHPTRSEIFGVSTTGGYVWILDPRVDQVTARIAVGALPYALDFSPDGNRVYTTASGNNTLVAIDVKSRAIVGRAATGHEPVLAHVTPDGKSVLVVNRRDGSLGIHDAATLAPRGSVSVVAQPEDVVVLPDSSLAFVLSRSERRISVVDLRRGVLVTNLELAGKPTDMLMKPDGGELYVISPEAHGLQAINTETHEVGDYMVLGSAPTRGVLSEDATLLYVSDTAAGRVTPVDIFNRRIVRDPGKGFPVPAGDSPAALRFDPAENLLLVVSQGSGDLAVIRVRTNFLVTMIPVGDHPQELAVKLY